MKPVEEKIAELVAVERRRASRATTARMVALARRGGLSVEALAAQLEVTTERVRQLQRRGERMLAEEAA